MKEAHMNNEKDQDCGKGAVEQDRPGQKGNTSLRNQLGHRGTDPLVQSSDTDFPEPGENPEHSGEPEEKTGKED
jgi:hypothetical protein